MQDSKTLENQWNDRACPWRLHHNFTITDEGVALGADTLIAPAVKDVYDRTALAVDGNEERILALLSVAHDRPVSPAVLDDFRAASRALAKGDKSLALICLAQSGLPALDGWDGERNARGAAKALFMADRVLQDGADAGTLLKGLDLLPEILSPAEWRVLAKYNDNHDERGRFASKPSAGGVQVADGRPFGTVSDAKAEDPASKGDWKAMKNPTNRIGNEDFEAMRSALAQRKDLTDLQKFNLLSLYAWEGGLKTDKHGTVAGLTSDFLNSIGTKPPTSAGATIDPYLRYMDEAMHTIGGRTVPDTIKDPMAGAAFVDTVFYQGPGEGTELIQQAVNDVRKQIKQEDIKVDGKMGPATLGAYRDLVDDAKTRSSLLGALAEQRIKWLDKKPRKQAEIDSDKKRFNWFR